MIAERELNRHEAEIRLNILCNKLNLNPHLEFLTPEKLVATCTLTNAVGDRVSAGAGKGQCCALGALAESIEHYLSESGKYIETQQTLSDELLSRTEFNDDWIINSIPSSCTLHTCELQALDDDARLPVPAILLSPGEPLTFQTSSNTDLAFLAKYATNSGTALGCSENEAVLHALNEAIERHALSVYYLSVCGLAPPLNLKKPSSSFLHETFSSHLSLLRHSEKLRIYLTCDFYGTYFCIAINEQTTIDSLAVIGSGCSVLPDVALYRAVSEQMQCELLHNDEEKEADTLAAKLLSTSSRLQTLINPVLPTAVKSFHPPRTALSLRNQIQQTLLNLKKNGRSAFLRTLFNEPGLACAVQIYIPGLERFHLIRSGNPVAPQSALSRGIREPYAYL